MANIQIPSLPVAISLNGTEQLEAVQAGTSVRVTSAQLALYAANAKLTLNNYAALRLNTYAASTIFLLGGQTVGDGAGGIFIYEASDTTSADNGGTIIVDANSRRWYRLYEGALYTSWFGTTGNGVADDTTALQAAINFGIASSQDVVAPSGTYILSNTITFNPTADNRGFKFAGEYMGQDGNGTSFRLTATGKTAIFQVNTNAHLILHWQFADFRLETTVNHAATYGLLFNSTEYSTHMVRRVSIGAADGGTGGPNNAIGILAGTGANGEFIHFVDCGCDTVDTAFVSNAGQAYMQRFDHFTPNVNAGGTYFYLNLGGGGGGGLIVTDINGTSTQVSGVSNATLFKDGGQSSKVMFMGGRLENITTVYSNTAGIGPGGSVTFSEMEVGIDFDPTNGALTATAAVVNQDGNFLNFREMLFFANTAPVTFPIQGFGSFSTTWHCTFENCSFAGFARPPYGVQMSPGFSAGLKFINCVATPIGGFSQGNGQNMSLFERRIISQEFAPGARGTDDDNAWIEAGLPDNQITHPEIGTSYGSAVAPLSPWTLSSGSIGIYDWNNPIGGNGGPYDSSSFARLIVLAPNQSITQTLTGIDLSSTTIARYYNSSYNFSRLTWELFVRQINGSAGNNAACGVTFTLSDSVSGTILDSIEFMQGSSNKAQKITLSAEYIKQGSTTHPVITIKAGTVGSINLEIDWQYFSTYTKPSFNPVTSPATNTQDIGGSAESLRVWDRQMLPYKSDTYGATATVPLTNLQSDIYVSTTDNTLTWYNGVQWNKITGGGTFPKAQFLVGGSAPTTGFSITLAAETTILAPAGTLATGTITLPASPVANQKVTVCSTQQVSALTVTPGAGQSIVLAPTYLAAGVPMALIYDLANTTWYPT